MPADSYGTLYPVQELDVAIAMVRDNYAKKLEPTTAIGDTPFSMYCALKTKPQTLESATLWINITETYLFDNVGDKHSEATSRLSGSQKEANKLYKPPCKPYVTVPRRGQVQGRLYGSSSHGAIERASEIHSEEDAAISKVTPGNLKYMIKAIPDATSDFVPDLSTETKTTALLVTILDIIQPNVLNIIMPQLVVQKTSIFCHN